MGRKKRDSGLYYFILEIFSIFLGVTIAFLASHWNDVRKDRITEQKILAELKVELGTDLSDIQNNINGHNLGLVAVNLFQRYCNGQPVDLDSLGQFFERLHRDYLSITNTTAYETLKSKGLEIITNEELRNDIVRLYDFEYEILEKLEEQYTPAQFHQNYFTILSRHFKNHMKVEGGSVIFTRAYGREPDTEIMMIFREIDSWRNFLMASYQQAQESIANLTRQIDNELKED
ncbi:hypothetical protein BFP97_01040 [Roseivirga sp. 4D4]|uniref:hypothetical protein n=1 Tax=Roseivirga sp. 4D4 TaxID=1889784 RepID=UPI000853A93A|nr:hypothetical protein [Roseivirga sp. 4D4]OEK00184.1 hypothetical protein BFP97_01040 [Roseivirga sp. 4D4]